MYQPRIRDDQVQALYRLKQATGRKMTDLIQEAVDRYLATIRKEVKTNDDLPKV
ncbi:MAG: hypothetical protein ACE5JO_07345 [Candidatus Binatia bacterium]